MNIIELTLEIPRKSETETTPPWPYKTWEAKKNAKVERVGDKPKRLIDLPCDVLEGVV